MAWGTEVIETKDKKGGVLGTVDRWQQCGIAYSVEIKVLVVFLLVRLPAFMRGGMIYSSSHSNEVMFTIFPTRLSAKAHATSLGRLLTPYLPNM